MCLSEMLCEEAVRHVRVGSFRGKSRLQVRERDLRDNFGKSRGDGTLSEGIKSFRVSAKA